ncbi:tetratricopeptide repeat-containing sensor histidine kinase [Pararhodonellum marinum]|uniref:tetratricopeptide repeat-containing sensor histidine kinase n=1 Tax=Pararhodonellum marinum TaxID=2755358 RepID=UPI00188E774E|nr:tetratricopeptide repeat protein [Pararhodonellum marinum]
MKIFLWLGLTVVFISPGFSQSDLLDSLQQIVALDKKDSTHAKALYAIGVNLERSDLKKSTESYFNVLKLPVGPGVEKYQASAAIRLGGNYSATGQPDSVEHYFQLAKNYIDTYPEDQKMPYQYHNGMGVHYGRYEQYDQAFYHYHAAAEMDPSIIGEDNVAGVYLNLAGVYRIVEDQKRGMEATFKALAIFEKTQNKTGLAYVYNLLGTIFYDLKQYDDSEKNLLKSLEYRKVLGDKRGEATVLANLGTLMMDKGNYNGALKNFSEAMSIQETLGLKEMVGVQQINIGKNYEKMGEYQKALEFLKSAKTTLQNAGVNRHDALLLTDMGKVQRLLKQKEEAYTNLIAASQTVRDKKQYTEAVTAFKNLKEYHLEEANFKEALEAQSLEYAYRDSVGLISMQTQLKELESKYSLDLKENEISLLKTEQELDRAALAKRKANQNLTITVFVFLILLAGILVNKYRTVGRTKRLLEVEKLRNSIARDLHDDLGSTLSSIHILSQMALQRKESADKSIFSKINAQTATMMDKLGDIVWSIHPDNDSLEQLLSKMQEFAGEILEPKGISYAFEVDEHVKGIKLDLDKRRNLFLIFKEAVNNVAKYAESKYLQVKLEVNQGSLSLMLKDDGKGFDMATIKKGNGLSNMHQRAELMGGNMSIESLPNLGTSIHLQAPIT